MGLGTEENSVNIWAQSVKLACIWIIILRQQRVKKANKNEIKFINVTGNQFVSAYTSFPVR